MALVDEHGRLFGRFNLVDAVAGVFALGLIPLAYGAVILFRTPPPIITAVEPAALQAGPGQRVKIRGENLRPYMRVSFGNMQGQDFLFRSTTEAEVNLNDMGPGVYDVVLYDFAQERSRIAKAFTVLPAPIPPTKMVLVGAFGNLDADRAKRLTVGMVVPGVGKILEVGTPIPATMRVNAAPLVEIAMDQAVMLPAAIETHCDVRIQQGTPYCQVGPLILQHTSVLIGEGSGGKLPFQIDQVRSTDPLEAITIVARFGGPTSIVRGIRVGDVDQGVYANQLAAGATVTAVAFRTLSADATQADVTVRVQVARTASGWFYVGAPLRAGGSFALRTQRYELGGTVMQVSPEWSPAPR